MNIRSLFFASLIALPACQDHSGPDFMLPPQTDARVWLDAHVDAHEFLDAKIYEDAHVFLDAAPPTRSCVNKNPVVSAGTENLTIAFVCGSPTDAGSVQVTLKGGTGSGAETRIVPYTLQCATGDMAFNNFMTFPATQELLATHVAGGLFDVDCT